MRAKATIETVGVSPKKCLQHVAEKYRGVTASSRPSSRCQGKSDEANFLPVEGNGAPCLPDTSSKAERVLRYVASQAACVQGISSAYPSCTPNKVSCSLLQRRACRVPAIEAAGPWALPTTVAAPPGRRPGQRQSGSTLLGSGPRADVAKLFASRYNDRLAFVVIVPTVAAPAQRERVQRE